MSQRLDKVIREQCFERLNSSTDQLAALKNSVITVTGGTGFIGSWLAEMLTCLNDEFNFNCQINLLANDIDSFTERYPHLASHKSIELIQSDIRYLAELPRETEWLIHLAGIPDNRFHSMYPIETADTIVKGTQSVLNALSYCPQFKMMLNFSSGNIYGPQPLELEGLPEDYVGGPELGKVHMVYSEAKRYAESLCSAFRSQMKIPVVNLRPFAFIGPYQQLSSPWAINNFIQDALLSRPIRVLGSGETIRSYMYSTDLTYWALRILVGSESGQSFNVGSSEGVSLGELAKKISGHFESRSEILLSASTKVTKESKFVPDTRLARESFGLDMRVSLDEALKRTIQWHQNANG